MDARKRSYAGNLQSPAQNLRSRSSLWRGRTDVVARGRRYTAAAAAFKLNVADGAARGLCLSRARIIPYRCRPLLQRRGKVTGRAHPMQIGIAAIPKMGAAIPQRLIEVGHKVTVWNRSDVKLKPRPAHVA